VEKILIVFRERIVIVELAVLALLLQAVQMVNAVIGDMEKVRLEVVKVREQFIIAALFHTFATLLNGILTRKI
jgi:hypothetical protein